MKRGLSTETIVKPVGARCCSTSVACPSGHAKSGSRTLNTQAAASTLIGRSKVVPAGRETCSPIEHLARSGCRASWTRCWKDYPKGLIQRYSTILFCDRQGLSV